MLKQSSQRKGFGLFGLHSVLMAALLETASTAKMGETSGVLPRSHSVFSGGMAYPLFFLCALILSAAVPFVVKCAYRNCVGFVFIVLSW